MELYDRLIEEIKHAVYKPMLYTIYNKLEDEGYIKELSSKDKIRYDIDNFEYTLLKLDEEESKSIRLKRRIVVQKYKKLKYLLETTVDNTLPYVTLQFFHELGVIAITKLKNYNFDNINNN